MTVRDLLDTGVRVVRGRPADDIRARFIRTFRDDFSRAVVLTHEYDDDAVDLRVVARPCAASPHNRGCGGRRETE